MKKELCDAISSVFSEFFSGVRNMYGTKSTKSVEENLIHVPLEIVEDVKTDNSHVTLELVENEILKAKLMKELIYPIEEAIGVKEVVNNDVDDSALHKSEFEFEGDLMNLDDKSYLHEGKRVILNSSNEFQIDDSLGIVDFISPYYEEYVSPRVEGSTKSLLNCTVFPLVLTISYGSSHEPKYLKERLEYASRRRKKKKSKIFLSTVYHVADDIKYNLVCWKGRPRENLFDEKIRSCLVKWNGFPNSKIAQRFSSWFPSLLVACFCIRRSSCFQVGENDGDEGLYY